MKFVSPLAKPVARTAHPLEPITKDNFAEGESVAEGGDSERSRHLKFAMWLFLSTETLIFGSYFVIYLWNRLHQNAGFEIGSRHMDVWWGAANTFVLLTSSLCMAIAVQTKNRVARVFSLVGVLALGTVFLVVKAFEYWHHYKEGLFPGLRFTYTAELTAQVYAFFSLYLLGTGLHAVHMIIGLSLVKVTIFQTLRKKDTETMTELVGLYWHFVDLVWVFLFPAFYLIGSRP